MQKLFLLLFLSLAIANTNAQTNVRDSLKQLLQNEKTDTGKISLLCNLSFEYYESKPDTAMVMALEALSLSRRIGFEKGEAMSLNRIGNAYGIIGNYPKQLEVLLQALHLNEKINNIDGLHRNNNNIGLVYREQGDNRQAIEYFLKSKSFAEEAENKSAICIALVNIGESFYQLRLFDSAMVFTQQGHAIAFEIGYLRIIGNSFRIMGDINAGKNQHALALEYYRLSFPYLQSTERYVSLCASFLGIAQVFKKSGQNDSALFYANQSYRIAKERGFTFDMRDAARFLSYYYRKFNTDSAFYYQDISRAANDSIFSQQKQRQFQGLAFDEKLRQQEIAAAEIKAKEERKNNLQYAAIAIGLITFIILFLILSRSVVVNEKFIKFFGIMGLLAVFEFINLYIHPHLDRITNHSPVFMLAILMCIAALLIPLHHRLEKWITKIMVEKNKKIRLAAAKKTIQQLEGEQTN